MPNMTAMIATKSLVEPISFSLFGKDKQIALSIFFKGT
jgi:hypothetical protein